MFMLRKKNNEKQEIDKTNPKIEKKQEKKINNTIDLDMDYVDAIHDTAEFVFKDNDTIASTMSSIAVKVQDNEEGLSSAITKLNGVNDNAMSCKELLEKLMVENEKQNEVITHTLQEFHRSIESLLEETNKRNEELVAELRNFTQVVTKASEHVTQLNSITDQVRLISLNARIEAARAGSAGKGFAVVAGEIQKLADQSEGCTKEFTDVLHMIDKGAHDNEVLIRKNVEGLEEGCKELSNYLGEVKEGIEQSSKEHTNVCEALFATLGTNIQETAQTTDLIQKLINIFAENANDIASMCEMQVVQTSSIFEILDLSRQIKEMKMQKING